MMQNTNFKYDIAFSFVTEDEPLATALNDLLQDRLSTFLYSKKQEEIAGTDGETTFNNVFGKEARIVIVIYRNKWGQTPWTRIEETAIRNRAYNEGYEFAVFIPIDTTSILPQWLPKTQIWCDYQRWGLKAAAAIIEARVKAAGGEPHAESATDLAKQVKRQTDFENYRIEFLHSANGVHSALNAIEEMHKVFQSKCAEIKKDSGFNIEYIKARDGHMMVCAGGYCASIYWHHEYSNSLSDSSLSVFTWDGAPPCLGGYRLRDDPSVVSKTNYNFDINSAMSTGWFDPGKSEFLTSDIFVDHILKCLFEVIKKDPSDKKNR